MDLISQARYDESRVYLRLAQLGETAKRSPLELAWLYSHALQLLCDLGFQDEAFRECLNGLAKLSSASCSADPRGADARALVSHETMLYAQAFGTLRIRGGSARVGCPIWRGGRSRTLALFELLICFGDQPVAEELAIESLWPEASAEAGRRDLKITLHRLRHQLEPRLESGDRSRYIILRQGFLSFHPEFFVSDVTQFDVAIRRGRRNESDGRVDAACADYQQAVGLYEGPLLSEERYCDWVVEPRRRREKQLLASLRTLGSWAEERQDLPRATQWYEAYLNGDPCAEGIVQRLMRVHLRLGQRSEAIKAYVALHGVLAKELNTCPSPETETLYRSLRP